MNDNLTLPVHMPSPNSDISLPHNFPSALLSPLKLFKRNEIIDLTVKIPTSSSRKPEEEFRPPARWKTLEFKFYALVACIVIPIMAWIPMSLSSPSHPNYPFFRHRLSPSWFGTRVDNSDHQYRSFRNNFVALSVLFCAYLGIKFAWVHSGTTRPRNNLHLIPFNLCFSFIMLLGLHGASIIKIIVILTLNYIIAKSSRGSKIGPVLIWLFNGLILFANDAYSGYAFSSISPSLSYLDKWVGFYPRWHISFNITMLRMVSFSLDYYWSKHSQPAEVERNAIMTEKQRASFVHTPETYSYMNYLSYVLYPPLYIAGPILTFNDYMWQHRRAVRIEGIIAMSYFFRLVFSLLTMEAILHSMYLVAIKDTKAWIGDSPAEISMIGFWNLIIVWLKLLIPWRFFRLVAMMDNIDAPENMVRCVVNNYSSLGFWRSWHRSYNLWIIRYIYIPLGGNKHVVQNTVLIFTFVALWHDLTFKLLAWGWLVTLFIVPEILAGYLLPASQYGRKSWYRHVCAIGAVFNMLAMVFANLVGFVIGTDGAQFFLRRLFGTSEGIQFLLGACVCMFIGAQLMFEYREEEMRKGVFRRC